MTSYQLQTVCELLTGLLTCYNMRMGTQLAINKFAENEAFFQRIFEIGRRYKVSEFSRLGVDIRLANFRD